jgi:hypothetical protein
MTAFRIHAHDSLEGNKALLKRFKAFEMAESVLYPRQPSMDQVAVPWSSLL